MSDLTPEKLAELRQLLHSGPRDCAIGMLFVDNAEALLDAAAENLAAAWRPGRGGRLRGQSGMTADPLLAVNEKREREVR